MRRGLIIYQPDVSSWGCWGEGGVSPLVWYLTIHPSLALTLTLGASWWTKILWDFGRAVAPSLSHFHP
jgi:hypothetical protein